MITNGQFFEDLHISNIAVISGVRYFGRTVEQHLKGRKKCGILFIWDGEATIRTNEKETFVVSNGELVFLPKNKKYRLEYSAPRTTFVVVDFNIFDKCGRDVALFPVITLLAKDDATHQIAKTMTNFELCSASKTVNASFRKKELMYRLLGRIYSGRFSFSAVGEVDPQIADGVSLLEQSYLENLPIAKYAEASHVSISSFRSLFQKQFGTSPVKYRNYLRMERARELLSEGGFTVSEVAYACGFENVGYFCRYYRLVKGETPSETKRKYNIK